MTDYRLRTSINQEQDVVTVITFSHWRHQSASHKWLTITSVWYTSRSRSQVWLAVLIVTWRRYNNFRQPYVRSHASSSSFNRAVPLFTGSLRQLTARLCMGELTVLGVGTLSICFFSDSVDVAKFRENRPRDVEKSLWTGKNITT